VSKEVSGSLMKVSMALVWDSRIRRISAVLVLPTTSQITFGGAPSSRLSPLKLSSLLTIV